MDSAKLVTFRRHTFTVVLAIVTAILVVLTVMRVFGIDGGDYTASALALTPYGVIVSLVAGVVSLSTRRWWLGGIALVVTAALLALVLPRAFAAEQPNTQGHSLRIMASNLYFSQADPQTIVNLVRDNKVELLNLLELDQSMVDRLDKAGLFQLLPYHVLHATNGGGGSGIVSKFPLVEEHLSGPSKLQQPSARVNLGDGASVEIVAVHTISPVESVADWTSDFRSFPKPTKDLPVRILAGDFNATLDHGEFRRLMDAGYADAANQLGDGLNPSWPSGLFPPPLVTIDHVLVDDRVVVRDYRVFDVPGSDHRAVFAELSVPV